jgi:hypothetical protein
MSDSKKREIVMHASRGLLCAVVLSTAITLAGCVYVPPVWDADDAIHSVDEIEEGITTREEVLDILGEPDRVHEDGNVYYYAGEYSEGFIMSLGFPLPPGGGLLEEGRWYVRVIFDESGIVHWAEASDQRVETEARVNQLKEQAERGDANVPWKLGLIYSARRQSDNAWEWFCRAANNGHAAAQARLGNIYRSGEGSVAEDIEAYKWYSLAASDRHSPAGISATQFRDALANELSPEQIAEAEQLVEEWEPDPELCEADVNERAKQASLAHNARQGIAAAQYLLGSQATDDHEQYRWLCLAAHQKHDGAQVSFGRLFEDGTTLAYRDYVQAYKWYGLAESISNLPVRAKQRVIEKMIPAQIAEAERLIEAWKPNPADCEALPGAVLSEN